MKILVTGEHGQLARSLRERCQAFPALEFEFLGRAEADLAVPHSIAGWIEDSRPDIVINAAAYTAVDQAEDEPDLAFRLNAVAASEAAEAAAAVDAAIIQISTDYVFDGALDVPYREDDATGPLNVYGASKLAGEEEVKAANPRHLILRTSWVISPFGRNFAQTMVSAAQTRDELRVVSDQHGKPTSALDLADGILSIIGKWPADEALSGTYHVAGGGEASWFDVAAAIMEECRKLGMPSAQVQPIATSDWPTKARRPRNSVLDCSALERDFGISLPNWRHSLAKIVERIGAGD